MNNIFLLIICFRNTLVVNAINNLKLQIKYNSKYNKILKD